MRTVLVAGMALVAGCASPACESDAEPQVGVIRQLVYARADDGISDGFDLDGETSVEDGPTGCGVGDYTAPDGTPGVDNAWARLIPALEETEAQAVEALIQDAINSGALLLLFEIGGLDDPQDDECVDLELFRGEGTPSLGTDKLLETGQTFDRDTEAPSSRVEGASVVDGSLTARDMTIELPVTIFGVDFTFFLEDAAVRVDLHEDGSYTGVLGGGLDTAALIEVAQTENVDPALVDVVEALFAGSADLDPNGDGICEQISINFEFAGAGAWLFEE